MEATDSMTATEPGIRRSAARAGGLLGGFIGDAAAARFPDHGRIAVTQVSVVSGVPLSLLLMKARFSSVRAPALACSCRAAGLISAGSDCGPPACNAL